MKARAAKFQLVSPMAGDVSARGKAIDRLFASFRSGETFSRRVLFPTEFGGSSIAISRSRNSRHESTVAFVRFRFIHDCVLAQLRKTVKERRRRTTFHPAVASARLGQVGALYL